MAWSLFETNSGHDRPIQAEVLKTYWRLVGPTQRPITCALYRTGAGLELRTYRDASDVHGFVVLIQRRSPDLDDSLIGARLRRSYLEHLAFDVQLIPWPNRSWPAELVKAGADEAAGGFEIAVDQEPHGDRGGVPAACGEASKDRVGRSSFIEMKRLRIEFGSKALDARRIDVDAPGRKGLPRFKIFQVSLRHRRSPGLGDKASAVPTLPYT